MLAAAIRIPPLMIVIATTAEEYSVLATAIGIPLLMIVCLRMFYCMILHFCKSCVALIRCVFVGQLSK